MGRRQELIWAALDFAKACGAAYFITGTIPAIALSCSVCLYALILAAKLRERTVPVRGVASLLFWIALLDSATNSASRPAIFIWWFWTFALLQIFFEFRNYARSQASPQ